MQKRKRKKVLRTAQPPVVFEASPECIAGLGKGIQERKSDFTVSRVRLDGVWGAGPGSKSRPSQLGFALKWETKSAGFGELTIYLKKGKLVADTECMSRDFVHSVFRKFVDDMEIK